MDIKDLITMILQQTVKIIQFVQIDETSIETFYSQNSENMNFLEIMHSNDNFSVSSVQSFFRLMFQFYKYKKNRFKDDFQEFDRIVFFEMLGYLTKINEK